MHRCIRSGIWKREFVFNLSHIAYVLINLLLDTLETGAVSCACFSVFKAQSCKLYNGK